MSSLKRLAGFGQSVWLDYIRRTLLTGGELQRLITEDGVSGMTSNPAIFQKAIAGSTDYDGAISALATACELDDEAAYERLAIDDIRRAADQLRPIYDTSGGADGYVSLEVSPHLARDTAGTVAEARRLWQTVDKPNLMIKVPTTSEGIAAFEELLAQGVNVNMTLLFSRRTYEQVARTYIRGLERYRDQGGDPARLASVASFFVSRIDTEVDDRVEARLREVQGGDERALLKSVIGKTAVANAKLAYLSSQRIFRGEGWATLAALGARKQRLLWASTSTKNPAYRDVMYVEELIGADTVNTIPPATMNAFREHGEPRASLEADIEAAQEVIDTLPKIGIDLNEVTDGLLADGLRLFAEAYDKLLAAIGQARHEARAPRQRYCLPSALDRAVNATLDEWQAEEKMRRLWERDSTLWTGSDESRWLDWLGIAQDQLAHLTHLRRIAEETQGQYFRHTVLLGMGGSSLAPEVIRETFGRFDGHPELLVLDSTDPAQVRAIEQAVDLERTLFIVSSKSGGTLEPNAFKEYFFHRVTEAVGESRAGRLFIAITDPGSKLDHMARGDGFRRVFLGVPGIGGRYSALSDFGMVPASVSGVDVGAFLDRAEEMVEACASCVPARENPGLVLGAILGEAWRAGRDKLTLIASPGIRSLGAWLEQLVAESTGKRGKAIIPVDGEELGSPEAYGDDRLFVYIRLAAAADGVQDAAVDALEAAGQPVVRIELGDIGALGQEFFRWEMATAVAGAIMGVNPFDQPDVEASKGATRRLTSEYEQTGSLPEGAPLAQDGGIRLYADAGNAATLRARVGANASVGDYLKAHLGRIGTNDYFALLAYLHRDGAHAKALQMIRMRVRAAHRVATCLEFGPRFLHSTGQAYKGGPNTGVFLQLTCDDALDLPVPGHRYSFGVIKAAQAQGDFEVLAERGRRALRVHLEQDTASQLRRLDELIAAALA
jgi:transaldolase/glucose-6-phosphate isomerase